MNDEDEKSLSAQLAKLSPQDRERFDTDMIAFGNAVVLEEADGTVVYVPPERWPKEIRHAGQRRH